MPNIPYNETYFQTTCEECNAKGKIHRLKSKTQFVEVVKAEIEGHQDRKPACKTDVCVVTLAAPRYGRRIASRVRIE